MEDSLFGSLPAAKTHKRGSRGGSVGGHHSADADTEVWLTPRFILNALGTFDLDPCAAPNPKIWATAQRHLVYPQQDGLEIPWEGRVWMNPPYGLALGRWLGRLADHGRGTALTFARTDTEAWFQGIWERADALLFLRGRLTFHNADGSPAAHNSGGPSVLIAYGPRDAEMLLDSGLDGAPVALNLPTMIYMSMVRFQPVQHWREIVTDALKSLGGAGSLSQLYELLETHPKQAGNPNWRAKIRQTVARMRLPKIAGATYSLDFDGTAAAGT
jgi:hypothetical protein